MRTTLDLPDDLFRALKAKAAMDGVTLKELLTQYVVVGLRKPMPGPKTARRRSQVPIIKRRGRGVIPSLTPELQAKLEAEEDLAKFDRSFGR